MSHFTESIVEDIALGWLASLGRRVLRGPDIAPEAPAAHPLKIGIVRDMRLNGFDAPCVHTMYVGKSSGAMAIRPTSRRRRRRRCWSRPS